MNPVTPLPPASFSRRRDGACGPGPTLGAPTGATVDRVDAGGSMAATKVLGSLTNNLHHPPLAVCRPVARRCTAGRVPGPPTP